ncbi:MAG: hypothetical protein ACTSX6_14720 [Candidatus Heimdallarchaeaceae archaeon]
MNESEKFRLLCGERKEYKFKKPNGEYVVLEFEPLPASKLGDLWELIALSQKIGKDSDTDVVSKEYVGKAVALIKAMIRQTYPEQTLDEDTLDKFVARNYLKLVEILFELNNELGSDQLSEDSRKKITELRNKIKSNETSQIQK